jgi:hypothetical protein
MSRRVVDLMSRYRHHAAASFQVRVNEDSHFGVRFNTPIQLNYQYERRKVDPQLFRVGTGNIRSDGILRLAGGLHRDE